MELRGLSGFLRGLGFLFVGISALSTILARVLPAGPVIVITWSLIVILGSGFGFAFGRKRQAAGGDSLGT